MTGQEKIIAQVVREVMEHIPKTDEPKQTKVSRMTANITLDFAEALMKKVEAEAARIGIKVVTAVANAHGNPVAVRCMDDAYIGSFDVAVNKAYTCAAFKMPTAVLGQYSQPEGPLYGIQFTNQGRIVNFGGGVPLSIGDTIVGSIGISGGSAEQDTYLAQYATETFRQMTGQK